jgi:serine/threonine-protein kinase HipA
LWRRIVFGVLVSNVDDHVRNHGFLYDTGKAGWRLSPAYDINPVPIDVRPRILSMMIDDRDNTASFDLILEVGDYFGLRADDMKVIAGEVAAAVSRWREEAGLLYGSHTKEWISG